MNIQSLHYDFKVKSDKVDSLKNRNFLPAEIDWMLNTAIEEFVDNKYGDFESKQDLVDQLSSLTIKCPTSEQPPMVVSLVSDGVYQMKLNNLSFRYLHLVRLNVLATKEGCSSRLIRGNEVTHDELDRILLYPFDGPNFIWGRLPYLFGKEDFSVGNNSSINSSIYFYTKNDFNISEVYPEYIKRPKEVFFGGYNSLSGQYVSTDTPVSCDLPPAFHRRIVDIAVANAAMYLNNPDYPQKLQKTLTQ